MAWKPEKKPATLLTDHTSVETVCLNHWSVEALFTPQVSMLWKSLVPGY